MDPTFEYIELELDSTTAISAGNGVDYLNWPIFEFPSKQIVPAGIKVISAEIPFVFDTITTLNNNVQITYSDGGPAIDYYAQITPGTYTGPELATELKTQLDTVVLTKLAAFTVTWEGESPPSSTAYKYTITNQGVFTFTFGTSSPTLELGFPRGTTSGITIGPNTTVTSPNAASPEGPFYIYMNSQTLGPQTKVSLPDNQRFYNQIAKIPIDVNRGGTILYTDPVPDQWLTNRDATFTQFDLYLTLGRDQLQVPLDLKGLGFSLKLGILSYRAGGLSINQQGGQLRGGTFLRP